MENVAVQCKIFTCKDHLRTLSPKVKEKTLVVQWFQQLCNKISELLIEITSYVKHNAKTIQNPAKEKMLLYLLQLNATLSVLIRIFMLEGDTNITIIAARSCITKQISMCLDGLEEVLLKFTQQEENDGFVKFMDAALDKISEINIEKGAQDALNVCAEAKNVIEEVLCHGMSLAQVALNEDCNSIKGSSKEVLNTLESLKQEIAKPEPNISMCNLFVDSCCDKLCALERKVNVAVLKLSLKVFSECTKPLDDLYEFCGKQWDDSEEIFDELVADFDLHVDRMIQVGLFAVTCSTDTNCTLKMRSCLASLEALEGELVPAMASFRVDPNPHNELFAKILRDFWVKQSLTLKKYIYCIIDPFAFCQVTYEVIRDINQDLEEQFKTTAQVDKNLIKPITLQTKILFEMLVVSIKDSPPENQETVKKYLNDVINVTVEIDAAADKLLTEKEICKENVFRVFKRCKIQENILKKLVSTLGGSLLEKKDESGLGSNSSGKFEDSSGSAMDLIVSRGKQILKDRSVLYRTPMKTRSFKSKQHSVPLSRLLHLRNMQFTHSRLTNESSIDLQITDILDNLTSMSTSLMT